MGDHIESARAQFAALGIKPKQPLPELPPFPDPLRYVWNDFCEILSGVAGNGTGPIQVGWRDIASWSELTMSEVEPFEARLLVQLGQAYAASQLPPPTKAGAE